MGPITLFDKSFLQSLSLDESVWFDNFFYISICPLFFVETLADLEKAVRAGRTPEEEVGIIADKTPEMHGGPNAYHIDLCIANLLGHSIPMEGRIIVQHGYPVKAHGKAGIVYRESREAQAFRRWQEGAFLEVERLFARSWRHALSLHDPDTIKRIARKMGGNSKCRSLEEAKQIADEIVKSEDTPFERMKLVFLFLNLPRKIQIQVLKRWISSGSPPLSKYAPYVAYILTVEIFFLIAVGANLISSERASNRVDIAYLFYLPFCMVFVSSDKLHRRCVHLFLRSNQDFIWGEDLKEDLKRLNDHYSGLSEEIREIGVMRFASRPPKEMDSIISRLWDRHLPTWRSVPKEKKERDPVKDKALVDYLKKFSSATPLAPDQTDFRPYEAEMISIERRVRKKKGSWWQVPKNLPDED